MDQWQIHQPNSAERSNAWTASDFISVNRTWDKELLQVWIPAEAIPEILAIPIPINIGLQDGLSWKLTASGEFFTKSAYTYIQGVSNPISSFNELSISNNGLNWNWIWKPKCAEKNKKLHLDRVT